MKSPIESIVEIIKKTLDPDTIILFGSRALLTSTKDSDYDICVLKSGIDHRRKCAMKLYEALIHVGVPVDIIVETPESYNNLKNNPFMIYSEIERYGKVIYERTPAV